MATSRCIDCGEETDGCSLFNGQWMMMCEDCALKLWHLAFDDEHKES